MNGDALRSNLTFITSNGPKISGDVILGNRCRCCSAYKLQEKTEYGLAKTLHWFLVFHISIWWLKLCVRG